MIGSRSRRHSGARSRKPARSGSDAHARISPTVGNFSCGKSSRRHVCPLSRRREKRAFTFGRNVASPCSGMREEMRDRHYSRASSEGVDSGASEAGGLSLRSSSTFTSVSKLTDRLSSTVRALGKDSRRRLPIVSSPDRSPSTTAAARSILPRSVAEIRPAMASGTLGPVMKDSAPVMGSRSCVESYPEPRRGATGSAHAESRGSA